MKKIPRYTAERVTRALMQAAENSVRDFELCTKIEELIDSIELIKLDWKADNYTHESTYRGVPVLIFTSKGKIGLPYYSPKCKYIEEELPCHTFEEAEEILIRTIDSYEK